MFTTTLPFVFKAFDDLNASYLSITDGISEISIHQNQIDFLFGQGKVLYMEQLYQLKDIIKPVDISDITVFENQLIVSCRDLTAIKKKDKKSTNPLWVLKKIIDELANTVCACPSLEFVVSDSYIKCYIDKPNIALEDLIKVNKIFDANGILELGGQRAYVLFVKTDLPAGHENGDTQ